ncbi:MAG: hypothetical protein AB2A00_25950, partial [Myxococcota bacterium]
VVGLGIGGLGTGLILWGRQQQASADSLRADTSVEAERERAARTQAARENYDRSRVLLPVGGAVTLLGLVGTLVAAVVVMIDEILFVPARRSEHPVWDFVGPLAGYREPTTMWPNLPLPQIPYLFVKPPPKAEKPKPSDEKQPPAKEAEKPVEETPPTETPPPAQPHQEPRAHE